VLLCLGGADPQNHTLALAQQLVAEVAIDQLEIVVGNAYPHWAELCAWHSQQAASVTVHHGLEAEAFWTLLASCGAALTSSSTISYEYCAAGGGLLTVLQTADNQQHLHDFLLREGLARPAATLPNLLSAATRSIVQAQLRDVQRHWFDGTTSTRWHQLLQSVIARAALRLRQATLNDSPQLLSWTNDPLVRQFSYNPAPVLMAEHEQWFSARLADPDYLFLIATIDDIPVGSIRFAFVPVTQCATLSFVIGADFRGLKLSTKLLRIGSEIAFRHWREAVCSIIGHVKMNNLASLRSFRRAGFQELITESTPANSISFALARDER
jgi:UDP-2,4-diacetamido-2,4,6-trideoxy-beta-L-altropyranose hydrolase